jgi:hypothetical protein
MAILRSVDGQYYEVPDDQLARYLIPADKVKEKVQTGGGEDPGPPDPGPPGAGGPGPTVLVQIYGTSAPPPGGGGAPPPGGGGAPAPGAGGAAPEVQPYGWWNTWRNTYAPGWHNVWHNRW